MTRIITAFFFAFFVVACGTEEEVENPIADASDLMGASWELQKLTVLGGFVFTPDEPGKYTLNFENDNRLTGQSDCNTFTGEWVVEESLQISNFSSTRSLCISGSLHNYYSLYLRDVNGLEWQGDDLALRTPDMDVRLLFARRAKEVE